jgi:hypothetical protein
VMDVVFLVEFIENNGRHAELFRLQGKSPPELSEPFSTCL